MFQRESFLQAAKVRNSTDFLPNTLLCFVLTRFCARRLEEAARILATHRPVGRVGHLEEKILALQLSLEATRQENEELKERLRAIDQQQSHPRVEIHALPDKSVPLDESCATSSTSEATM